MPRWAAENKCYSCHNNGDAVRALFSARHLSYAVPTGAIADSERWLTRPDGWDHNHGDERFSDKRLARIQFAGALADGVETGAIHDKQALARAAELLVRDQAKDGSWRSDAEGNVGSPATYGVCLATFQARRVLEKADIQRYRAAIERADQWFIGVRPQSVTDAAAVLLALAGREGEASAEQRRAA